MKPTIFFVVIFTYCVAFSTATSCKGAVSLDQWSWEKVIPQFKAALVKFDVAFPYGDRHDVFCKLAEELASNRDIIIAQVGIKDYGDKENKELGERYGIQSKNDLPVVKLFTQNLENHVDFPLNNEKDWPVSSLRDFVRDNTNIYIGLPGCLEAFDKLAMKFINSDNKESQLKEAEELFDTLDPRDQSSAKTYLVFMKKIVDQGVQFVKQETARLGKILKEGKVKDQKKEELSHKLNVLHAFEVKKDEL